MLMRWEPSLNRYQQSGLKQAHQKCATQSVEQLTLVEQKEPLLKHSNGQRWVCPDRALPKPSPHGAAE